MSQSILCRLWLPQQSHLCEFPLRRSSTRKDESFRLQYPWMDNRECWPPPIYLNYSNHSSLIPPLLDHYSYPFKWFEHSRELQKYVVNRESDSVWSCGFDVYMCSGRENSKNVSQITWCAGSLEILPSITELLLCQIMLLRDSRSLE